MARKSSSSKSSRSKPSSGRKYRPAVSGRCVSTEYGKSHPKTTVKKWK